MTCNVWMVKTFQNIHLTPDGAFVTLDLFLGNNFESDIDLFDDAVVLEIFGCVLVRRQE